MTTPKLQDHLMSSVSYHRAVHYLDSGLEVVVIRLPHLHSVQISLLVKVGSRHENPRDNGLSHMLEHMFFRGCEGFEDSTALNAAMEDLGGQLDAYTTRDHSGYSVVVHPAHVEDALDILGRMFTAPKFDDINIERQIILEEMLDALDERGREIEIDTLSHQMHFADHGLAQSIEGPRKNVRRFSIDDLERHRRRFYGARNMVLCMAGAVDENHGLRSVERAFGRLLPGRASSNGRPPRKPESGFRSRRTDDPQTRLRLSFRTVADAHRDYPALSVMRSVLDGGLSARLQAEFVERRGIAYEIGADLITYADAGVLDIELVAAHRKIPFAIQTLADLLVNLRDESVPDAELSRVYSRLRIALELGLDSVSEMVQWFGVDHLFGRALSPHERYEELSSVSAGDIRRVARKYLSGHRLTAIAVGGARPREVSLGRKAFESLCSLL